MFSHLVIWPMTLQKVIKIVDPLPQPTELCSEGFFYPPINQEYQNKYVKI